MGYLNMKYQNRYKKISILKTKTKVTTVFMIFNINNLNKIK